MEALPIIVAFLVGLGAGTAFFCWVVGRALDSPQLRHMIWQSLVKRASAAEVLAWRRGQVPDSSVCE